MIGRFGRAPGQYRHVDFAPSFVALVLAAFLIALACHSAGAQTHSGAILIRHDFTESAQGWLISGDANMMEPIYNASGGHPGGYITGR